MTKAERIKQWRLENPEKAREQTAAAMRRMRERNRENAASYRARNPERARQSRRKCDATRRGAANYVAKVYVPKVQPAPVASVEREYARPEDSTLAERFAAWRKKTV
jgi:hypothetical protein